MRLAQNELADIFDTNPSDVAGLVMGVLAKYASSESLGDHYLSGDDRLLDFNMIDAIMGVCDLLGNGSYSKVYELDQNWVIKINCMDEYYSPNDCGFSWLKECVNIQTNIFAPRIASISQRDYLYVAVLERLDSNSIFTAPDGFCFTDLVYESKEDDFCFESYLGQMEEYPGMAVLDMLDRDDLMEIAATYEAVREAFSGDEDMLDFNVMIRDGEIPVICDPLASAGTPELGEGTSFDWKHSFV